MGNGQSRITVISPDRQLDLLLPGSVPVGDLMPQLLGLCTDHHDRAGALAWTLRPLGGIGLTPGSTLDTARIRDGAVLELSPRSASAARGCVEDVRDATEDAVDQSTRRWTGVDASTLAVVTLVCIAGLMLALPDLWVVSAGNGVPVSALAAGGSLSGCVYLARRGLDFAAHALVAVGLGWTAAAVLVATAPASAASTSFSHAQRGALAATAVLVAAVLLAYAEPRLAAWSAAAVIVFATAIVWIAMDLAGRSTDEAVALGTVVGVLSLGIAPRASLAAGGLAQLDYVVRSRGSVDPGAVVEVFARSRALLTGALLATAALTAAGSARLEFAGSPLQVALAVAVAVCLILRSRAFSQFLHVLTLVLCGIVALLVQLSADLLDTAPRPATVAVAVVVAVGSLALARGGLGRPTDVAAARSRRLLDIAESLMVATLIPLLAANLGVLEWIRGLVN